MENRAGMQFPSTVSQYESLIVIMCNICLWNNRSCTFTDPYHIRHWTIVFVVYINFNTLGWCLLFQCLIVAPYDKNPVNEFFSFFGDFSFQVRARYYAPVGFWLVFVLLLQSYCYRLTIINFYIFWIQVFSQSRHDELWLSYKNVLCSICKFICFSETIVYFKSF